MKNFMQRNSFAVNFPSILACFLLLSFAISCRKNDVKRLKNYDQVNLVANNGNYNAAHIDPLQMNAWGLSWSPTGTAWVNSQAGHVSALYDA